VAAGAKTIKTEVLETTAQGRRWAPKNHEPQEIMDSGASGIIGQTPHRQVDMPINIDRNEGD